jgi:hypothetical protein
MVCALRQFPRAQLSAYEGERAMLKLIINEDWENEGETEKDEAAPEPKERPGVGQPALRLIPGGGRAVRNPSDGPQDDVSYGHSG